MTVASDKTLATFHARHKSIMYPFVRRTKHNGVSHGLSCAGYDVRTKQKLRLYPGDFELASTLEHFDMPTNYVGVVHDKSTWARKGIAVQNTVLEPGWKGFLTLEITYHKPLSWFDNLMLTLFNLKFRKNYIIIDEGTAIAQILFYEVDEHVGTPYDGKYQNQIDEPVSAIFEQ